VQEEENKSETRQVPGKRAKAPDLTVFSTVKRLVVLSLTLVVLLVPAASASADFSFQTTTLEPPAGARVEDVAVGDLDGTNGPDIVTAYEAGGLSVQLNDGHGHFGAPQMYATGCRVSQVELADVGAPPSSIFPDGHLDAVFTCVFNGGDTIYLGRMFGDGAGGLSEPDMFLESQYGFANGLALSHQSFALFDFRGPTGPPVPAWSYLEGGLGGFHRFLCVSFDWSTRQCTPSAEPGAPFVAGQVAEAELFTTGGSEGLLDWGFHPEERASTRDFGPLPKVTAGGDASLSIAIGDLQGDGPDILTSAGTSGAVPEEPATGRVSVLYGDSGGVAVQHATTFPSALGVEGIATGDFDLDGHTDLVGTDWHWSAATGGVGGVFFQAGNGAGQLGTPQETPLYNGERFDVNPPLVADLDGNGTPDVVAVVGGKVQVLLNQKAPPPPSPTGTTGAPGTTGSSAHGKPLTGIAKVPGLVKALADGTLLLGTATNPPTAGVTITITVPPIKKKAKGSSVSALAQKVAGKKAKKPVVIGNAHIVVPAGKTVPLKVKLSAKGRGMLKKGPLHAQLTLLATSADGTKQSETKSLTIKATAKKKGKKK
jgi:hypothetical protein